MNSMRGFIAPVGEFRRRGITVGLGIDSMFSDYFDVVHACVLMARLKEQRECGRPRGTDVDFARGLLSA